MKPLNSMGVAEQVEALYELADVLKAVIVDNGQVMDWEEAVDAAAHRATVAPSQMRIARTFAVSEGIIQQDRVAATLSAA